VCQRLSVILVELQRHHAVILKIVKFAEISNLSTDSLLLHFSDTIVVLCYYVMVPLLPPVNCVGDSWGWRLHATSAQWAARLTSEHSRRSSPSRFCNPRFFSKMGSLCACELDVSRVAPRVRAKHVQPEVRNLRGREDRCASERHSVELHYDDDLPVASRGYALSGLLKTLRRISEAGVARRPR
jgi:hypothetical protein